MSWTDARQRSLARRVVSHVLVGGEVSGVLFSESYGLGDTGPFLRVLIDYWSDERRALGAAILALQGRWELRAGEGATMPSTEDALTAASISSQLETLWTLRDVPITDARMPDVAPHLLVTFSDGRELFVWGGECKHLEPWELQFDKGTYHVVCTGLGMSIWVPDHFGGSRSS